MDEFNFGLLRISVVQILRANGFDKCKPSTLNVVTDLYLKYFNLLVQKSQTYSGLRNSRELESSDVLQGMLDIGLIKNSDKFNTKSIDAFEEWLESTSFRTAKALNTLPNNVIKTIIEKRKFEENQKDDDKQKKLKQRQDFYNNFKQDIDGNDENEEYNENDLRLNWLNYLIEKDVRLGNNTKIMNSALNESDIKGDYLMDSSVELNKLLPINLNKEREDEEQTEQQ